MNEQQERRFAVIISLVVLILVTLPYLLAAGSGGADYDFNGFLLNPQDGNSYLAKMRQGWEGQWRFRLPFTVDPGEGAYLFLFYLFLGRLARFVGLPLVVVFHIARLLGTGLLLWTLWRYFGKLISSSRSRRLAFALASLGSGMGWLLLPTGAFTSDFWVAEAFPFLSAYANPHFPIGLALVLWLVMPPLDLPIRGWRAAAMLAGAALLSLINPFGVVIALMILGGCLLWQWVARKSWPQELFLRTLLTAFGGLPLLTYDLWVTFTDPVFAGWNAQNLTPSPPLWDMLVSLSPALLLALAGLPALIRSEAGSSLEGAEPAAKGVPLLVWAGLGLILMYVPVELQRRFMLGIYIPLAGLGALGLESLARDKPARRRLWTIGVFLLALPTNLIILLAAIQGIRTHDSQIYLTSEEAQALAWIEEKTSPDALILASPEMGLFIPAYTGRRVIYGHPFETVDAPVQAMAVTRFFEGSLSPQKVQEFIADFDVDLVFYGSRERALGGISLPSAWDPVFQSNDVTLFLPELP